MEADIVGILTEALTAEVEAVLADQGAGLSADTATYQTIISLASSKYKLDYQERDPFP